MTLASRLDEAHRAGRRVLEAADRQGVCEEDRFAIRLAVEEALANAIKHGNRCDPQKVVVLSCRIGKRKVRVSVADQGGGFQPEGIADCTHEENLCKPYGRGIMLMRSYMSDVSYNRRGNRVTLTRVRGCAQARKTQNA